MPLSSTKVILAHGRAGSGTTATALETARDAEHTRVGQLTRGILIP
jgi:hypothetical protein